MDIYPRVLSVCTGHAGLDLGIRIACPEARAVCYVEREAFAVTNLVSKMQAQILDEAPIYSDLTQLDGAPWRGRVDLIIGGPPCQGWSLAGKREGASDERNLWPAVYRLMREIRPDALFLENVPPIVREGYYHETIEPELEGIGYRCEWGLYTAAEVGAPHDRCRFFLLAVAEPPERRTNSAEEPGASRQHNLRRRNRKEDSDRSSGKSDSMADAERDRCGESPTALRRRKLKPPSVSEELANPQHDSGCTEQQHESRGRKTSSPEHEPVSGVIGKGLGDSECGGWIAWAPEAGREARDAAGQPGPFPPRPSDADAWRYVIDGYSHLRPAGREQEIESMVHRVADGMAPRMDRCRGCGEGVVPVVAAVAFRSLLARFA